MKNLIIFFLLFMSASCLKVIGQANCVPSPPFVFPATPSCSDNQNPVPFTPFNSYQYWDWRGEGSGQCMEGTEHFWFQTVDLVNPLKEATSPFFSVNNQPNAIKLSGLDYQPDDGWELAYRFFGEENYATTRNGQQDFYTSTPMFALLNRKTGTLRVMMMPTQNVSSGSTVIKIEFGSGSYKSALFNHAYEFPAAVEKFDNHNSKMSAINSAITCGPTDDCRTWYFADFPLAYDPCICMYPSQIEITMHQVTTANITLVTKGRIEQVVENSSVKSNDFTTLISNAKTIDGVFNAGMKGYKTGENLAEDANKFIEKNKEFFINNKLLSQSTIDKLKETGPSWASGIGAAIGVANFFYSLVGGKESGNRPMNFSVNLNTSGIWSTSIPNTDNRYKTPGSITPPPSIQLRGKELPIYDRIPGVVSLLNAPKFEYVEYSAASVPKNYTYFSDVLQQTLTVNYSMPKVREYRLLNEPHFVVNPASNMEIVKIDADIFYNEEAYMDTVTNVKSWPLFKRPIRETGPFLLGEYPLTQNLAGTCHPVNQNDWNYVDHRTIGLDKVAFNQFCQNQGVEIFSMTPKKVSNTDPEVYYLGKTQFKTPTDNVLALRNYTFKTYYNSQNPFITIRFFIYLREKGSSEIYQIKVMTYRVLAEDISRSTVDPLTLKYHVTNPATCFYDLPFSADRQYYDWKSIGIDLSPFASTTYQSMPLYLTLTGLVNTSKTASHKIVISIGTYFENPGYTILIKAQEIEVDPSVEIPPFVELIAEKVLPFANSGFLATNSEVMTICTTGVYPTRTPSRLSASSEPRPLPTHFSNMKLSYPIPNPTSGECSLSFDLAEEGGYRMVVSNVLGEEVKVLEQRDFAAAGKYQVQFNTHNLESGVYFITLTADGFRQARKLVVVK